NENRSLKLENANLRAQFQVAEEKLSSLEGSIERIQNFTKKLNLITNVEDEERVMKLALSSTTRSGSTLNTDGGTSNSGVTRLPSSEMMIRDPQVPDKPFVEERNGEMGSVARDAHDYSVLSVRIDRALRQSQLREQGVLQLWDSLSER